MLIDPLQQIDHVQKNGIDDFAEFRGHGRIFGIRDGEQGKLQGDLFVGQVDDNSLLALEGVPVGDHRLFQPHGQRLASHHVFPGGVVAADVEIEPVALRRQGRRRLGQPVQAQALDAQAEKFVDLLDTAQLPVQAPLFQQGRRTRARRGSAAARPRTSATRCPAIRIPS